MYTNIPCIYKNSRHELYKVRPSFLTNGLLGLIRQSPIWSMWRKRHQWPLSQLLRSYIEYRYLFRDSQPLRYRRSVIKLWRDAAHSKSRTAYFSRFQLAESEFRVRIIVSGSIKRKFRAFVVTKYHTGQSLKILRHGSSGVSSKALYIHCIREVRSGSNRFFFRFRLIKRESGSQIIVKNIASKFLAFAMSKYRKTTMNILPTMNILRDDR